MARTTATRASSSRPAAACGPDCSASRPTSAASTTEGCSPASIRQIYANVLEKWLSVDSAVILDERIGQPFEVVL